MQSARVEREQPVPASCPRPRGLEGASGALMPDLASNAPIGLGGPHQQAQLLRVRELLAEVLPRNSFWRRRLSGVEPPEDIEGYRKLPFTSNRELSQDARSRPPFGSNLTYGLEAYTKYHQTSGTMGRPLAILDTASSWDWWGRCWGSVLDACGVEEQDRAFFAFSFAPFIGFWSAFDAVGQRGALAVPGGGASTTGRLRLLLETGCTVLFSTPTYALHMAQVAQRLGIDLAGSAVRKAVLAGEPGGSLPAVRRRITEAWGAQVYDHAGSSEIGAYGIPCPQGRGIYVNEQEFVAEVVEVGGSQPVGDGETGELVITNLGRWGCPVIRYRTGDLVRARREGRLLLEGGLLGRVDHMILLRGVNLHPSAIEEAIRREAGGAEFRITVTRRGEMDEATVEVEASPEACQAIRTEIRELFGVRVEIRDASPGTLPRWESKARRFRDLRQQFKRAVPSPR